jgi:HK97 family phage major capsid protein
MREAKRVSEMIDREEFVKEYRRIVEEAVARDMKLISDELVKEHGKVMGEFRRTQEEHQERLEELESRGSSPGKTAKLRSAERDHRDVFLKRARRPHDGELKMRLAEAERKAFETKLVSVGTDAAGGFAVPQEIASEIEKLEKKFSPVRDLVRVRPVSTGDFKALVNIRGVTSGWVGETGTRSETATPSLRERTPTFGEIYAYPQTTEWALDDMFFDVGEWLAEEVAEEFAEEEGLAVISGNGTSKPTGMLNTAPVATADLASPLRSADAYEFVASDLTPGGVAILPDVLIDLVYRVNSRYRANGTFVMNSATAAVVRKLKDGQSNYLWAQSFAAGQPERLLGYPVVIWEQMQDVGANNHPIAFGDFRRGYILCDRSPIRITVDANITTPDRIKYFVRRREGGHVWNGDAIKFLKTL